MQIEHKTEKGTLEIWKDIEGFEGRYQISNYGRVKSLDRIVFNNGSNLIGKRKGIILKPGINGAGYYFVNFWDGFRNKAFRIHRLVALAFCDAYVKGLHVNHKNGHKLNNSPENLEWVTPSENIKHAIRTGLNPRKSGEKNHRSLLTEQDVLSMRDLYKQGLSQIEISNKFNSVTKGTIKNILGNRTWKHLL